MASVDEKFPPWVRMSTTDALCNEGSYVIGAGDEGGWADYGRYVALRLMLARTEGATLDLSVPGAAARLCRALGLDAGGLDAFVGRLVAAGAMDGELWEGRRVVFDPDMASSQASYAQRCAAGRKAIRERWSKDRDMAVIDGGAGKRGKGTRRSEGM